MRENLHGPFVVLVDSNSWLLHYVPRGIAWALTRDRRFEPKLYKLFSEGKQVDEEARQEMMEPAEEAEDDGIASCRRLRLECCLLSSNLRKMHADSSTVARTKES